VSLSLDEAYLDVSHCTDFWGSATLIAQEIRRQFFAEHQLTASIKGTLPFFSFSHSAHRGDRGNKTKQELIGWKRCKKAKYKPISLRL